MLIEELMSRKVACAEPGLAIARVTTLMREHNYSCLVIAERMQPLGVITERDLVGVLARAQEEPGVFDLPAGDFMSSPPVTINEDADLFEAMVLVQTRKIRHLPVVDAAGRLSGIVTQSDLVRGHLGLIETQREIIEHAVAERTKALTEANERLKALSLEDALLGIGNRRAMEVDLRYTHAAALRYDGSYSVALFDVDFFKAYNDEYGHSAGDRALRRIADHLRTCVRRSDRLYRYGGEELLLLLPSTCAADAQVMAGRLVKGLANLTLKHKGSPLGRLTLSCGLSVLEAAGLDRSGWQSVVARADQALYEAKKAGRNRAVSSDRATTRLRVA